MIYELHRKVHNNIGDLFSNPSRYFYFPNCKSQELIDNNSTLVDQILVVGGGGLIHKKFQLHLQDLIKKNPKKIVLWGIGHNFGRKHIQKSKEKVFFPDWIYQCDLIGIRDYVAGYENLYLPCASCMHPAFNIIYEEKQEVGYFLHKFKTKIKDTDNKSIMYNNNVDFKKVIEFLGSHETIVTDSYHGAYWAQILGKNVQVESWSVKFDHFKNPPLFLENINDTPLKTSNKINYNFLSECRQLNKQFYNKFLELIN